MRRGLIALVCLLALVWAARADDYPSGPVRLLVPFAAGGPTDVVTRILAELLSARWGGKAVIVENRPGAGTIVMAAAVAKARPDGLTLGMATNSLLINPAIGMKLPYDTFRDLIGVSMVATQPVALVATKSFPANSLAETVAYAKSLAKPLNYTSPGPRGVGHLAGELLKQKAGIAMVHVSYNGSAPALTDVMAGRVPLMFDIWHSARRYVETGRLKLIAGAGPDPLPGAESVPVIATTYPGFSVVAFNALIAPGATPPALVERISAEVRAVVSSPEFAERTRPLGINAGGNTPKELNAWFAQEVEKWAEIAKAADVKAE
ncbi:MAG TPA: tripartite tricarboxylate transporter substrate-binding protein [Xanthobacteraceae bacterium]|nr:tripartite tricarboxylate transporter substrate-binding protein [Xanthobacteraceae bacterium]